MKNTTNIVLIGGLAVLIILGYLIASPSGSSIFSSASSTDSVLEETSFTDERERVLGLLPDVVATVNGQDITDEEFYDIGVQVANIARAQGADIADPAVEQQINEQAVASLINNTLLLQAASGAGITADEEEVQARYDEIVAVAGDEASFNAQLEQNGLTEEKLKSDIRKDLVIQAYLDTTLKLDELVVTEEEVSIYYRGAKASNPDIPALEEVSEAIVNQLESEKRNELVGEHLDMLRDAAVIEQYL